MHRRDGIGIDILAHDGLGIFVMDFLTDAKLRVPKHLIASVEQVRSAIEREAFAEVDIKQLRGYPYFRARLDPANRLLLQFADHGGKKACLALELLEQGAYDRSRFLRGAQVDEESGIERHPAKADDVSKTAVPVRYLHPGRAEFHLLDKPISFDEHQEQLHRTPLPMVLVGCAGSGKTALTLTKLRELHGEVLYVTQSAYLAESSASLYFSHGYENSSQNVDFLSFRALLDSIEVPPGRAVTLREFRSFFKRHEGALRFTTAHQMFEELHGVITADPSGPLSLDEYLALGVKQSIYAPEHREVVHRFLEKYCAWMKDNKLHDTNLVAHAYRRRAEPTYDAVVVDEVQDLTNAELALILAHLKDPRGFLLCGDANQIVHPNFFSWSKVKSLFYVQEELAARAPIHVLEVNYRSSRAITGLANTLLKLKNARFGSIDRESTALVRSASAREGSVRGLVKKDRVLSELNRKTRGSAEVAVVVLTEEQKAEAKKTFSTPLVFSVHEAKGLEYETVILYDIVSYERSRFREICEGIVPEDLEKDDLVYARAKDKTDKTLEVYKFFINALYVALTRAVDSVYWVESDASHPMLGLLRIAVGDDVSQVTTKASSLEDWQKEARRLELQGKQEQAEAIRKNILRLSPVPWPVMTAERIREHHQRAFMPGSVYNKAKQQLFENGAFHDLASLCYALKVRAKYIPARPATEEGKLWRERTMAPYLAGDVAKAMADVDRYGVDHRSMLGMTPLMMAADVGHVALVETLCERGARLDAVDPFGRMPIHFALRRAFESRAFAQSRLGPLYELLCPTAIEIEVDGRRLRLGRHQGEFFALLCLVARFHGFYGKFFRRGGFTAKHIADEAIDAFPRSVMPDERRRRVYWNGVLARGEVDASYRPARKLWRREKVGNYVPSAARIRVAGDTANSERFESLDELLMIHLMDAVQVK